MTGISNKGGLPKEESCDKYVVKKLNTASKSVKAFINYGTNPNILPFSFIYYAGKPSIKLLIGCIFFGAGINIVIGVFNVFKNIIL